MGAASPTTLHSPLDLIAAGLEQTGWAAELCDPNWRLVWVSSELKTLVGEHDEQRIALGEHILVNRMTPGWLRMTSPESRRKWVEDNVPLMIEETPGGRAALAAMLEPELAPVVESLEPRQAPVWTSLIDTRGTELDVGQVRYFGVRARKAAGQNLGVIYLYGSNLPATLLPLLTRGNRAMFERMARLVEPGRREAAVLFADVQASGALARRLPSAAYFRVMQALTTAIDAAVIACNGIAGKHAGDGVTAFFLADDTGSASAAARAAIEAARGVVAAARRTADEDKLVEPGDVLLNVGLHWGGPLYMGQVVTDGRLEVTALGDEVNECARIQQAARDGAVLASKGLIERLDDADAATVGVDPTTVSYRPLAELASDEKIVRDAGGIAVTRLAE